MTRRIACVVFVTLIWGASTDNEEKIRDVFKSNLTRNDFSGLLQSLIKLNERRISVLQKLYRLEDYGVLSEVLRSGGERKEDEDPSNMFLIVMSKGPIDARNVVNTFNLLRGDVKSRAEDDDNQYADPEDDYELLGVVTLEDLATRKNLAIPVSGKAYNDDDGSNEDYDDPHDYTRDIKTSDEFKENVAPPVEMRSRKFAKSALRSIQHTECINANKKEIDQCSRACNKANEDVCDRRSCSLRAKRTLAEECIINCKNVFDSKDCKEE